MSTQITLITPNDLSLYHAKRHLIAVGPTVSVQTALDLMYKNKITSLPLFSHNDSTIVSIVNLFDIMLYLVGLTVMTVHKEEFKLEEPIENVLGLDFDRESYRVHQCDCRDDLLETLRLFASGIHRALVIDFRDKDYSPWLFSQTDVIRHIHSHFGCIADLVSVDATVEALGFLENKPMVTVPVTASALSVYRLMAKENLGGLPIVDSDNRLQGDLCLEDLPGANLERIEQLVLPCGDYVKMMAGHQFITPTCTPTTSLKDVIDIMATQDTHRVWIVSSENLLTLVGVITMSDIIRLICSKHI
ncbi:hypothetical protein BDF14DRAFT_1777777 [Spinellus fusiger]|nr:hypothetical protein BDF14DRAFT_1777777 [Spinellus fusiger]